MTHLRALYIIYISKYKIAFMVFHIQATIYGPSEERHCVSLPAMHLQLANTTYEWKRNVYFPTLKMNLEW